MVRRKRPRPSIGQPPSGDHVPWHDEEGQREHDVAMLRYMGRMLRQAGREFVDAWRHRHDR